MLREYVVESIIELNRRIKTGAEGLFHRDATARGEISRSQLLHNGCKERWRNLEIEERMGIATQVRGQSEVEPRVSEVAANVGHAFGEASEHRLIRRLTIGREDLMHAIARHRPEVIIRYVIGSDTDDRHGEQAALLKVVEGRQCHLVGEIP